MMDTPPLQGNVVERSNRFSPPWIRWISALYSVLRSNQFDNVTQYEASPSTGFSVVVDDNVGLLYLANPSVLAAGTVILSADLVNQRPIRIVSEGGVTALVVSSTSTIVNGPTALSAGTAVELIYLSANDTWYRVA